MKLQREHEDLLSQIEKGKRDEEMAIARSMEDKKDYA